MHPSNSTPTAPAPLSVPVLTKVKPSNTHLFRVRVDVQGRRDGQDWCGWAADASDASRRALGDARNRWKGYSFVVRSCLQVGV